MATGAVPASFSGLKGRDSSMGYAKSMDFVRVCDLKRVKSGRTRISVLRSQNPSPDIAEMQPASEGSPLLGIKFKQK
ncbi:4-hydroxy-3-methylbut-2-en-1-yl diphosphate synthase, chloroplastic-like protein [Corchorus olitorius]|uniref:4-hydroxy-3-methylbut-2-en-1-yl diphosphate synthase, chloroplastic-like protein n=1 Tax=Corchorus olitorius TaxID=93759 RepID=A0A1R3J9K0_9ROSI|nr:4-hydroxy-3-methylbut-2-en-1-yl diphosphate synthase, chloroplastic-like protein [Corchorus olitorius]